ncbi:MAG: hypothetical protein JW768_07030 [Chitinispirillaceae bacterium]|nr:hypothetical protein [Chitinispirillaceae bacterium]
MRLKILLLAVALVLMNCAAYKQLKPKPGLESKEAGYIELKKKAKKNFSLKKGKKYFITFPGPSEDHFYLVVTSPQKQKFATSLTDRLEKKKTPGALIGDETWGPETMSVYPINKSVPAYYLLIDKVSENLKDLPIKYRYTPQWRFKFEGKHAIYKETLAKNRVDRGVYNAIGTSLHLEDFNYTLVMDTVSKHTAELEKLEKELRALESIFPSDMLNSTDVAYLNYKKLKKELDEEIAFQTAYVSVLGFFHREYQTRKNPFTFLGFTEDFIAYFSKKKELPDHIVKESQTYLEKRLAELPAFFDERLKTKEDAAPLDTSYFRVGARNLLDSLHAVAEVAMPKELAAVVKFMTDFDANGNAMLGIKDSLAELAKFVKEGPSLPPDDFFKKVNARAAGLEQVIPKGIDKSYGKYHEMPCAKKLNEAIGAFNTEVLKQIAQYREAEQMVVQLNVLKAGKDYSGMIGMLKAKPELTFLIEKYRGLDKMSIDAQVGAIKTALGSNAWRDAESGLKTLHADQNFLDPAMLQVKEAAVMDYEDSLYSKVERVTRRAVTKFLDDNVNKFEDIDSFYTDSVFLPVYDITFSSGSRKELVQRKATLVADLAKMKENEFPARAVQLLFKEFVKNPNDNGVLKARAIVAHGNHYKGEDDEVKRRIAEADPMRAKWIVEPKKYRRVLVVPVTDNRRGTNKYVVRFNVKIKKEEAVFPVYDVNIKLPKEVAQNAASTQWYETIKLNKKLLKNEGRFTITAPTAENDYVCQMTPVQMSKEKTNVLEIVFKYPAFKVVQVSVMVQKPIIKKN